MKRPPTRQVKPKGLIYDDYSDGEISLISEWMTEEKMGQGIDRMWERWCKRADVPFVPRQKAPAKTE